MLNVLNLGCGHTPLKDTNTTKYYNMDMIKQEGVIKHNLTKVPYPFQDKSFDFIYMFHIIEHIAEPHHLTVLGEVKRLLKPEGIFYIAYPEFRKCAQNYIDNKNQDREYWKKTIYGRGSTNWDRHIALIDTEYFVPLMRLAGLDPFKITPEKTQHHNTLISAKPGEATLTYEELMGKEFAVSP